jgi:hypothetical protein
VNSPPAARPAQSDPGGFQARADGQQVEVRTYDGDLIKTVTAETAEKLLAPGPGGRFIAERVGDHIRVKLGIRYVSPRDAKRPSPPPDLEQIKRREPERYKGTWRGSKDPHIGHGAIGRATVDETIFRHIQSGEKN